MLPRQLSFLSAALLAAATVSTPDPVVAQNQPAAAAAAANPKLAGTWEGSYTTDGPSGAMTIVLKSGSPWVVTNTMAGDVPPATEPREVSTDGDKIVWKQIFGEYDVTFKASLSVDGAQLTGVLEAYQSGSLVAGGAFTLSRKPN